MTCDAGLAVRLAVWRKARGWTQEAAATTVGIPRRTWVGYENSERQPGADALASLARAGCDVAWLLTGDRSAHVALHGTETPMPMMTIGQIAEALGITKRSAERRAVRDGWAFTCQTCRGGQRRVYPVDQLPEDVRERVIVISPRPADVAIQAAFGGGVVHQGLPRAIPWELLVVSVALIASVITVMQ